MKTYWQDSDELWYYGGQYVVEHSDGWEVCIVPIHCGEYDEEYDQHKNEAKRIAELIAEALRGKI